MQRQPHIVASDYDTDTAYLTDAPAPPPPQPARTNDELNLTVLQRHNPSVHQILSHANFAVVYIFSPTTQQWEKCGIEGTLFVCQLTPTTVPGASAPIERYSVTILNRKGLENFDLELLSGEDVEITEQYVIVQVMGEDGTPNIYGLWIFSEPGTSTAQTREINAAIIQELANRAESSRAIAQEEAAAAAEPQVDYTSYDGAAEYGTNGSAQESYPSEAAGRQINLNDLFGQSQQQAPPLQSAPQQIPQQIPHQAHFPQPGLPHGSQQNALLDLFQKARQGYNG